METEKIIDSCKAILNFLVEENDPEIRKLKYKDFMNKFSYLENIHDYNLETKKQYDVIIFVVVKVELDALDSVLSFKSKGVRPKEEFNNIHCWEYSLERNPRQELYGLHTPSALSLLIVFLGDAGDVNCSISCMRIYSKCDSHLAILCGIAAGLEDEIKKYSVVISNGVIDYEPQRIEAGGKVLFRPNNYDIDSRTVRDVTFLETLDVSWRQYFLKELSKRQMELDACSLTLDALSTVSLKAGVIASGKKLIADDTTIQNLRKQLTYKKGIIAAEMEGGGFCPASKEFDKKWLVIRGISDYGGDDKNDPLNKSRQFVAATSAVTALVFYLKAVYRRTNEPGGNEQF